MHQIDKIKAVKRALEAADPDPSFLEAAADKRAAKGRAQYICPHCGHGAHGDGLQWRTAAIWHCYTCGKDHDLIDLMGAHNGLTNAAEAAEACRQYFNLSIPELNNQGGRAWNDRPLSWEESERAVDFDGSQQRQQAQRPEGRGQAVNAQQQKGAPTETKEAQKLNDDEEYSRKCREYVARCHQNAKNTDYFRRRHIPDELVERFNMGYDPDFPHSAPLSAEQRARGLSPEYAYNTHNSGGTWEAVIIPIGDGSRFIARNIGIAPNAEGATEQQKLSRYTVSQPPRYLFNPAALSSGRPVFIVEGYFDAPSIIAAGGEALALGGTANSMIYSALEATHPKTVIIALDNDQRGQEFAAKLYDELNSPTKHPELAALRVRMAPPSLYGSFKDANAALIGDPEFPARVMAEEAAAVDAEHEEERKEEAEYMAEHEAGFAALLAEQQDMTPRIKTGFWTFDDAIGGGLRHSRTYTIAAMPSVGKSTFILQMACSIAANYDTNRRDVLFFGLEMSETELLAKAVSFLTAQEAIEAHNGHYWKGYKTFVDNQLKCDNRLYAMKEHLQRLHYDDMKPEYFENEEAFETWLGTMYEAARQAGAVSANAVEEGIKFSRLWDNQKEQAKAAQDRYYRDIHPHMFIFQGQFSIPDICAAIDRHIAIRKRQNPDMLPPVIFIDYLQILDKVDGEKYTSDKDKLDQDSKALKTQIAVHYKTPVWCVSSVNRAAYNQGGEMTALKGSGEIEFNADFIFFLVFSRLGREGYDFNREKGRPVRSVMLQMRKSRSERASDSPIYFSYFPEWNYYAGTLTPPPFPPKEGESEDDRGGTAGDVVEEDSSAEDLIKGGAITQERMIEAAGTLTLRQKPDTIANFAKQLRCTRADIEKFVSEHSDCWKIEDGRAIYTNPYTAREAAERGRAQEGKGAQAEAAGDVVEYDEEGGENVPL